MPGIKSKDLDKKGCNGCLEWVAPNSIQTPTRIGCIRCSSASTAMFVLRTSLFNCTPVGRHQTQWWPRQKAIYFKWLGPELFLSVVWPTGVELLVFFCSSVPVVLFDTPGISRWRSQHVVSVESSSLFHHSIYLWFILFPWWSIDELENLHADRTTVCFEPWQKPRARLGSRKTGLRPPVVFTDRSKAVLLLWFIFICYHIYNVCLLHNFVAILRLSALPSALYFILSKLALWPPHFNSCSPCFLYD